MEQNNAKMNFVLLNIMNKMYAFQLRSELKQLPRIVSKKTKLKLQDVQIIIALQV